MLQRRALEKDYLEINEKVGILLPDPVNKTSSLRYCHEALFSLSIALAIVFAITVTTTQSFLLKWKIEVNVFFRLNPHHELGGYAVIAISTATVALCLFAVLRILAKSFLAKKILGPIAGVVSVTVAPVLIFYVNRQYGWLFFEAALCAAFVLGRYYITVRIPNWVGVCVLASHSLLWLWTFTQQFFESVILVVPLAGLFSGIIWLFYISRLYRPDA
jgi:hypothetical protein